MITMKQARKSFANRSIVMQRKNGQIVKKRDLNRKGTSFKQWAKKEYTDNSSLSPKLFMIVNT